MSTVAVPLQDLAQRIHQHEAELAQLRKAFEARQAQLERLTQRKETLEAQLREVEAEIRAAGSGTVPAPKPTPIAAKPPAPARMARLAGGVSMPQLLVQLVQQANRPMTLKDLTQEVVRRKVPTRTHNIPGLIKSRISELVKKGILSRASDQPGVVLARAGESKAPRTTASNGQKKMPIVAARPAMSATRTALGDLLTKLLAKTTRPIKARELAEQALAAGYPTKSRDFTNVVWVAVGKLDNVENVKGQGYRLKRGKTSAGGK
jgi:hypothetical protein